MLSQAKAKELAKKYSFDRYPPNIEKKQVKLKKNDKRPLDELDLSIEFE